MPETPRRYWLLEKHLVVRAKNEQGETCTLWLYPGDAITAMRADPPPKCPTCGRPLDKGDVTDDQG